MAAVRQKPGPQPSGLIQVNARIPMTRNVTPRSQRNGRMKKTLSALSLTTALVCGAAAPVLAQQKGDMTLGLGLHWIEPDSSASTTTAGPVKVDGNARPTLTFEYFLADNVGLEVLASWPFEHDINLVGTGKIGETKHLPPTVSLQYHFTNNSKITPFVGAGLNYTYFFDDTSPLGSLSLDESWGLALHAGADFAINEKSSLRLDVRYIDIETDVRLGGAPIGKVKIDPWVIGAAYVMKF